MSQPGTGLQPKVDAVDQSGMDRLPTVIVRQISNRNAAVVKVARDEWTGIVAVGKDPEPRCGWK